MTTEALTIARERLPRWAYVELAYAIKQATPAQPPANPPSRPQPTVAVKSAGPRRAKVAFVGRQPSAQDIARGEPFAGIVGAEFNKAYLEPLGLRRDEVLLTYMMPSDECDMSVWQGWVEAEIEHYQPRVVVALSQLTKDILGDLPDFTLPHPVTVRKAGGSSELDRKLRQIRKALDDDDGSTGARRQEAQATWDRDWHNMLPVDGAGRFVYYRHWRGLDREEAELSEKDLLQTDHSLHGDLLFEGADGEAFGWTILLGPTAANRDGKLRLDTDTLRALVKPAHPRKWLDFGQNGTGCSVPPGGPGASEKSWCHYVRVTRGTYKIGVVTPRSVEVFLDSPDLSGRLMIVRPLLDGDRRWLINKPTDQTPRAESQDLADLISEQRSKGNPYVIIGKPGEKPVRYDTSTGEAVSKVSDDSPLNSIPILKADPLKHIVYGCPLDPYGRTGAELDAHDDWPPPWEVERLAHEFVRRGGMVIGLQHRERADAQVVESWVEQYPSPEDYRAAMAGESHRVWRRPFGTDIAHSGSWWVGTELGPREWKLYEEGELNTFSIRGNGWRTEIELAQLPEVEFIDLVEAKVDDA